MASGNVTPANAHVRAGLATPQSNSSIKGTGGHLIAARAEGHAQRPVFMAVQNFEGFAGEGAPIAYGGDDIRGDNPGSVWVKMCRAHA